MIDGLRLAGPIVLALAAAFFLNWRAVRWGLDPPAFESGWAGRRLLAALLIAGVLWLGIFLPLASLGGPPPDPSTISRPQLFLLHLVFLATMVGWYALGFAGAPPSARAASAGPEPPGRRFARQFGVATPSPLTELGIGLAAGLGAWLAVIVILVLVGFLIWTVGGEAALPQEPPAMVPWIAALPLGLRLALSASAGFAEELFFRGFLQPRTGVAFSTVLFVIAHAGYGQPLMLLGVSLLSLIFAALVRWRQNVWPAVVAHAVFDVLQLTVVIPKALELLEGPSLPL